MNNACSINKHAQFVIEISSSVRDQQLQPHRDKTRLPDFGYTKSENTTATIRSFCD